jgi:regulator of ribosome biosynthesis
MADSAMEGIELDLAGLLAIDSRQSDGPPDAEATRGAVEELVRAVFSLPAESTEEGRMVPLPAPTFLLPRAKPVPRERPLTKWEKFVKEKGIQKKKSRDRLVWDEARQDYLPRYGAKSSKSLDRAAILPHTDKVKPGDDPFAMAERERKARVRENKKKQLANLGRGEKRRASSQKLNPMLALDVAATGPSGKKHLPKSKLRDALTVAQRSTASSGRFDQKVKNEPKAKLAGKKRKLPDPTPRRGALSAEKEQSEKILSRVLGQHP